MYKLYDEKQKEMNDIKITEKPDWVSWDEIHDVLWKAHAPNRENGIIMSFPSLSGEEIRKMIEPEGKFFIALDCKKVVGTLGIMKGKGHPWFSKGSQYAHVCFAGVLPQYSGNGIYQSLNNLRERYAVENNYSVMIADTNEQNIKMIGIKKKEGYRLIAYMACKDHYNVVMAKWLNECPYPLWYIKLRFLLSKLYKKSRYEMVPGKGRTKRFGI